LSRLLLRGTLASVKYRRCLSLAILAACGDGAGPSNDVVLTLGPVDAYGYAIVGDDVHPPLLARVEARACLETPDGSTCSGDSDCLPAEACLCGRFVWRPNLCVPAECRASGDCDALCLLGEGNTAACPQGLFCGRDESLCEHGGDCPGNGTACVYVAATDRFECSKTDNCGY
jgi:hypothetical protein